MAQNNKNTNEHNKNINNNSNMIEATASLAVDDKTRHGTYLIPAPYDGFDHTPGTMISKQVKVRDGRQTKKDHLTLDDAAFELVDCPTALATEDFYKIQDGNKDLSKKYFDEVAKFVKEKIGCDEVIIFQSQVRNENRSDGKSNPVGGGVNRYLTGRVHTDSSPVSADVQALKLLEEKDDSTKYQRYSYMNLWRNISDEPIHNNHLAMMDQRSAVAPDDYIPKDHVSPTGASQMWQLSARHYDRHEWYYFPKMTKSEGILLKQVDSDFTNTGRTCFHMAIADPNVPSTAPPRESIEVRMFCYWKETESGVDSMPTKENINIDDIKNTTQMIFEQPLHTANAATLLKALIGKIPVVGAILVLLLVRALALWKFVTTKKVENRPYTGKPEDYVDRFLHEVEQFPTKPKVVIDTIKSKLKGKEEMEGIQLYTKAIVDDNFSRHGTSAFNEVQKNEVVSYLIKNEKYISVAKKHLGKLM